MFSRVAVVLSLLTLSAALASCGSSGEVQAQEAPETAEVEWYDAAPLMASLRPSARAATLRQSGLARAEDLPLYDLDLRLDDDLAGYRLEERIYFVNQTGAPLRQVALRIFANAHANDAAAAPVQVEEARCLDGRECEPRALTPSTLVLALARPLPPEGRIRIALRVRGRLRPIDDASQSLLGQGMASLGALTGAGHGDHGLLATSAGIASLGSFYPVLAPFREGAWDLGDGSTMGDLVTDALCHVRVHVNAPRGTTIVASGHEGPSLVEGGRARVEVVAAFAREVAVLASRRFEHLARDVGGVTVRSHFLPESRAAGAEVLAVASAALALFERRFGPYPWADLDLVQAPLEGGAGGVEFTALATVATMFYRPVSAGQAGPLAALAGGAAGLEARRASMLEMVTAHEVAHQWWHGIVGSDSRAHPFLDEGLAQYSAILYFESRYDAARASAETDAQVVAAYHTMRLLGHPDGPVARPVGAFGEPVVYAGLVYGKGPLVHRALRRALGDRAYFAGLRAFALEHRFREAPPRALFDRLARGDHRARVRTLEQRWLERTHGDEDLGAADLGRMLGGAGGGSGVGGEELGPLLEALGGEGGLGRMLEGLGGGHDLGGLLEALGGGASGGGDRQLQELLDALEPRPTE